MTRILVIVDMQIEHRVYVGAAEGKTLTAAEWGTAWRATADWAGARWKQAVYVISRAAMWADYTVLLEDVRNSQPTADAILTALSGLPYRLRRKDREDGSYWVLDSIADLGEVEQITVCGAMTDVCVAATVTGLRQRLGVDRVDVLIGGCFPEVWREEYIRDPLLRRT